MQVEIVRTLILAVAAASALTVAVDIMTVVMFDGAMLIVEFVVEEVG